MSYLVTTVILTCIASLPGVFCDGDNSNVSQALEFLERYETEGASVKYNVTEAEYQHKTNITTENEHKLLEQQLKEAEFDKSMRNEAVRFNITAMPDDVARQLTFIKDIGTSAEPDVDKFKTMRTLQTGMETIYGTAKVCLRGSGCLELEPGLTDLLATSRDYDKLLEAWKGWRDATGPNMKDSYVKYVDAVNEAIKITGYSDMGEYWRSWYESPTFEEDVANLFAQVRPLYEQLHGYVRRKLKGIYGADKFPASGHIPAHLLGNMWAQEWNNIVNDVSPYPNKKSLDVTEEMVKKGYNATRMFRTAEEFFVSLGFDPMVDTFWTKSMLVKPKDRDVVCHGSAWDFKNGEDFRIKMCTVITHEDLMTIHHEMGHVEYYMQYKNQPLVYRGGANPGFHEAVGDVMTLSVQTPTHLKKLNLLDEVPGDPETDLNFLMNMALQKVAFLPFGYLIDQWRWSVFRGDTRPDDYNTNWWDLRCRFQGLSSPVPRSTSDFDPGAKYHVAGDVPYIRYFVSFIIQFQFHKAACRASGHVGPLHTCDIYNNTAAGARIRQMLQLGKSKHWQDAMEVLTGQRNMDATALLDYFHPLLEFLKKENGNDYGWDPQCPFLEPETVMTSTSKSCDSVGKLTVSNNVTEAEKFLAAYDEEAARVLSAVYEAQFSSETNITEYNDNLYVQKQVDRAEFDVRRQREALKFNATALPGTMARQLTLIKNIGPSAEPNTTKVKLLKKVQTEMESIYGKAKPCLSPKECLSLEPDLTRLMATSRDYDRLLAAWQGWRNETGRKMKPLYQSYVQLFNEAVNASCYHDAGEYWRSWYETPTFEEDVANLFAQVRPLYEQLHGYVRRKLKGKYGADKFPSSGHIPAHLLGNMWAQEWNSIFDLVEPFQGKVSVDVTNELVRQNYTVLKMFKTAEDFYDSIGLPKMVPDFWNKSMLEKPNDPGREVVCHGSATDFYTGNDFRIKMCTDITQEDLMTIHHEMGHIEYFMAYKDQPVVFRDGANPGFHEAIGDVMTLSVQTPKHLHTIGLLSQEPTDNETDINFLMLMALQKVAFLPFGYLIDQWRWSVFRGDTEPDEYNQDWWDLRCRYQGLSSPVPRTALDFDPGAKYHVPADVPYIRYFVSFIIQFQFQKAACDAAGHTGPLHKCDVYRNKAAGKLIGDMLRLGRLKPWPEAMAAVTGQRKMDATALLDYFHPLFEFLKKENGNDFGWDPQCPLPERPGTVKTTSTSKSCDSVGNMAVSNNVTEAEEFLKAYDEEAARVISDMYEAEFTSKTNITEYNDDQFVQKQVAKAELDVRRQQEALKFNMAAMPGTIARQLTLIKNIGPSAERNETKLKLLKKVQTEMESIYGKAKPCLSPNECLSLEPDLTRLMATSDDYDRLLAAWQGWRDETGRKMKPLYQSYVQLFNEAVNASCYHDAGEYWRSWYETPTFEEDVANLFAQVRPLYEQLHGYVRRKLKGIYGADRFPASGHIPAHLLGNMWAQDWTSIFRTVEPFKGNVSVDVTAEMVKRNYTVLKMFQTAEDFYVSIGLQKMVPDFWGKSMFEKPTEPGREVVCHASATDFYTGTDFRIKMCTDITQEYLMIIHHEMGHIEYYMAYKDQPVVFRDGANPGFHEAIGDVMTLSVQTPKHLHKIGLLSEEPTDYETDISFLMRMALQKVAFLPFGYLIDQWRWSIFRGDTEPDEYNKHWWDLRCRYQGISAPVARTPSDFDPGAKYHVPGNTPYIRYFVSFIIQFQFHKAACDAAGHTGPLHKCDIYNNKAAGKLIGDMLRLGLSKPWPDAMEAVTGQRKMDATALLDYFRPLLDYLRQENGNDFGWDPHCPDVVETKSVTTPKTTNKASSSGPPLFIIVVLLVILLLY